MINSELWLINEPFLFAFQLIIQSIFRARISLVTSISNIYLCYLVSGNKSYQQLTKAVIVLISPVLPTLSSFSIWGRVEGWEGGTHLVLTGKTLRKPRQRLWIPPSLHFRQFIDPRGLFADHHIQLLPSNFNYCNRIWQTYDNNDLHPSRIIFCSLNYCLIIEFINSAH